MKRLILAAILIGTPLAAKEHHAQHEMQPIKPCATGVKADTRKDCWTPGDSESWNKGRMKVDANGRPMHARAGDSTTPAAPNSMDAETSAPQGTMAPDPEPKR